MKDREYSTKDIDKILSGKYNSVVASGWRYDTNAVVLRITGKKFMFI